MSVYVFLATGFEEIEALATVDILRRANVETKMISVLGDLIVTGAHNIAVNCDDTLLNVIKNDLPDAIVFPGGMPGATNLAKNDCLKDFATKCYLNNKKICAICASPAIVLNEFDLLKNHNWTCYPNMESSTKSEYQKNWQEKDVVISDNVITSRGPGTTSYFAYAILQEMGLQEVAKNLQKGMLF